MVPRRDSQPGLPSLTSSGGLRPRPSQPPAWTLTRLDRGSIGNRSPRRVGIAKRRYAAAPPSFYAASTPSQSSRALRRRSPNVSDVHGDQPTRHQRRVGCRRHPGNQEGDCGYASRATRTSPSRRLQRLIGAGQAAAQHLPNGIAVGSPTQLRVGAPRRSLEERSSPTQRKCQVKTFGTWQPTQRRSSGPRSAEMPGGGPRRLPSACPAFPSPAAMKSHRRIQ